ncbi:MAG: gamma carbonic anhydrase family protein [Candidatus Thermoplasmatota archaeon]|nr:gamma carbonic anhydrase family protein [Candidatus Thermoplasmatota archaeon]MBU1914013.1 gamma carbonic anhydrase family protein [Candidatus Thermoplasmatota archaeon]
MPGPKIDPSCYVAPEAIIIGDVVIDKGCSIWPFAVIRADLSQVRIGEGSSIQEHCQIHGNPGRPIIIGRNVSVGHGAIVHAAQIGDYVIVGMNSTILDGAEIGSGSIVGANALVKEGVKVPEGSLVVGVPAKIVKQGDPSLREAAKRNAEAYHKLRDAHKRGEFARYKA